jgi:hypothetical protein
MNSLLGDRFLKRFAGEFRHKLKHPASNTEGQKPDSDDERVPGPNENAAEEDHEKETAGTQKAGQDSTAVQPQVEPDLCVQKDYSPARWLESHGKLCMQAQ